jgi:hypothetical protein
MRAGYGRKNKRPPLTLAPVTYPGSVRSDGSEMESPSAGQGSRRRRYMPTWPGQNKVRGSL